MNTDLECFERLGVEVGLDGNEDDLGGREAGIVGCAEVHAPGHNNACNIGAKSSIILARSAIIHNSEGQDRQGLLNSLYFKSKVRRSKVQFFHCCM